MFVSKMIHPSMRRYIPMSKIMSRNRMLPHTSTVKYSIQNNVNGPLVNKTNNKSRKKKNYNKEGEFQNQVSGKLNQRKGDNRNINSHGHNRKKKIGSEEPHVNRKDANQRRSGIRYEKIMAEYQKDKDMPETVPKAVKMLLKLRDLRVKNSRNGVSVSKKKLYPIISIIEKEKNEIFKQPSIIPPIDIYNEIIALACGTGDIHMAKKLLYEVGDKCALSHKTLAPYFTLCTEIRGPKEFKSAKKWKRILDEIQRGRFRMDKTIDNDLFLPLLFGLAKKGSIENLNYVIRHYMQSKFFIDPNIDAYNAIISGWVFRKDMYRANKVLEDIFGNNLMPTELTYERMIQGYTFQNDVDTAYRYLDALLELQDGNVRTIDQDGNAESITRFYNKPTVHASSQRTLHPRIMNYFFNMHLRKNDIERLKEAIIRFKTLNVDFKNIKSLTNLAKVYGIIGDKESMLRAIMKLDEMKEIRGDHAFLDIAMSAFKHGGNIDDGNIYFHAVKDILKELHYYGFQVTPTFVVTLVRELTSRKQVGDALKLTDFVMNSDANITKSFNTHPIAHSKKKDDLFRILYSQMIIELNKSTRNDIHSDKLLEINNYFLHPSNKDLLKLDNASYKLVMTSLFAAYKREGMDLRRWALLNIGYDFFLDASTNVKFKPSHYNFVMTLRFVEEMGDVDKLFKVIKIMNEKLTVQESEELDFVLKRIDQLKSPEENDTVRMEKLMSKAGERGEFKFDPRRFKPTSKKLSEAELKYKKMKYPHIFQNQEYLLKQAMRTFKRRESHLARQSEIMNQEIRYRKQMNPENNAVNSDESLYNSIFQPLQNVAVSNGIVLKTGDDYYSFRKFLENAKELLQLDISHVYYIINQYAGHIGTTRDKRNKKLKSEQLLIEVHEILHALKQTVTEEINTETDQRIDLLNKILQKQLQSHAILLKIVAELNMQRAADEGIACGLIRDIQENMIHMTKEIDELKHTALNHNNEYLRRSDYFEDGIYMEGERPQWLLKDKNGDFKYGEAVVGSISGTKTTCAKYVHTPGNSLTFNLIPCYDDVSDNGENIVVNNYLDNNAFPIENEEFGDALFHKSELQNGIETDSLDLFLKENDSYSDILNSYDNFHDGNIAEASNIMNKEAFKIEEINMKEMSMKNGFVDNLTTSDETISDSMDVVDEIQENHDDVGEPSSFDIPFFIPKERITGKISGATAVLERRVTHRLLQTMFPLSVCIAYAKEYTWQELVEYMIECGYRREDFTLNIYNKLLTAYTAADKDDECVEILDEMRRLFVKRNYDSYAALIYKHAQSGNLEKWNEVRRRQKKDPIALSKEFSDMVEMHNRHKTFGEMWKNLKIGSTNGDVDEVLRIFNEMEQVGYPIDAEVYIRIAYAYAMNGDHESVNDVINESKAKGFEPNFDTFFWPFVAYIKHEGIKTAKYKGRHDEVIARNHIGVKLKYDANDVDDDEEDEDDYDLEDDLTGGAYDNEVDGKNWDTYSKQVEHEYSRNTNKIFDADGKVIGAEEKEYVPYEKEIFEKEDIHHIIDHIILMDRHRVDKKLGWMTKILKISDLTYTNRDKIIHALYTRTRIRHWEEKVGTEGNRRDLYYLNYKEEMMKENKMKDEIVIEVQQDVVDESGSAMKPM